MRVMRKASAAGTKVSPLSERLIRSMTVIGQMGEVAEGLVSDGLALADGPSEQMGDVGLPLVDPLGRSHMDGAGS